MSQGITYWKRWILCCLIILTIIATLQWQYRSSGHVKKAWIDPHSVKLSTKTFKSIGFATTWFTFNWPQFDRYIKAGSITCKSTCTFTKNLSLADGLIFHGRDLTEKSLQLRKSQYQYWLYLNGECPIFTQQFGFNVAGKPHLFRYAFNYTATYMTNSDIKAPYGRFLRRSAVLMPNQTQFYNPKLKTGMAFAFISDCYAKHRLKYIRELQKYMQVDVYGKCADRKELRNPPYGYDTVTKYSAKYRFFLAFENSYCKDYITEKFFLGFERQSVSVVFGGLSRKEYESVMPHNNSFIYAFDFKSSRDLALHLTALANDEKRYAEFFDWKRFYRLDYLAHEYITCGICKNYVTYEYFLCQFCDKLHEPDKSKPVIADLSKYYDINANCRKP